MKVRDGGIGDCVLIGYRISSCVWGQEWWGLAIACRQVVASRACSAGGWVLSENGAFGLGQSGLRASWRYVDGTRR